MPHEKERIGQHKRLLEMEIGRFLYVLGYDDVARAHIIPRVCEAFEKAAAEIFEMQKTAKMEEWTNAG